MLIPSSLSPSPRADSNPRNPGCSDASASIFSAMSPYPGSGARRREVKITAKQESSSADRPGIGFSSYATSECDDGEGDKYTYRHSVCNPAAVELALGEPLGKSASLHFKRADNLAADPFAAA